MDDLLAAKGLSRETLEREVSKEHRHRIARDIGEDWEVFATYIGVPDQEVEDIKAEHTRPINRRFAMMKRWYRLYGSGATYIKLVNSLMEVGRIDLIDQLVLLVVNDQLLTDVSEPKSDLPTNDKVNKNDNIVQTTFYCKAEQRNFNTNYRSRTQCHWYKMCILIIILVVALLILIIVIVLPIINNYYYNNIQPSMQSYKPIEINIITQLQSYAQNSDSLFSRNVLSVYPDIDGMFDFKISNTVGSRSSELHGTKGCSDNRKVRITEKRSGLMA